MKRLTKEQILLLHRALITQSGGSVEIRDNGLLESAINAPFQIQTCQCIIWTKSQSDQFTDIYQKRYISGNALFFQRVDFFAAM